MKLRIWEVSNHLTTAFNQNPTVFRSGAPIMQMWLIGKNAAILQRGEGIALSYRGYLSIYFRPDLCKVSADSIAAAIDYLDKTPTDDASIKRAIADLVSMMTYASL